MKSLIAACALALFVTTPSWAKQAEQAETTQVAKHATSSLDEFARSARTAADHAEAAKRYRERSETLHGEATRLEESLRRQPTQARSSMAYKWPAMDRTDTNKTASLRREAMNARQAAHEASVAADRHYRLAIEKGFTQTAD